jgi:hypothetical protein
VARGHPSAHDAREGVRRRGYVEHLH